MRSILVDAGPIIALFDSSDQYHKQAVNFLKITQAQLFTTWPVVTECSHMLRFSTRVQVNLLTWIDRGGLQVEHTSPSEIQRLIDLVAKYDDVPMDLADASLIVLAEQKNLKEVASIDSDYYIYRNVRNQYLQNVFVNWS